jgi:RNA polymerase sigma-70 factor (ECF subfamily)
VGTSEASADLLRQARLGSSEALGTLLQACGPRLLALIRLRLGPSLRSRLESRDILQATVLKAVQRLETFQGDGTASLVGWLARIAENEIRDQADYHGRQRRDAFRDVPLEDAPELARLASQVRSQTSRIALGERGLRLERALESLSSDHREVVVLRKIEELSFEQVSQRLGRSPDACRMLLARAMAALTLAMEDER